MGSTLITPGRCGRFRPVGVPSSAGTFGVVIDPIPSSLVQSGRDLTECRPSPDGDRIAMVERRGGAAAIVTVGLPDGPGGEVRPEQTFTFGEPPAPGRGLGGGCYAWVTSPDEAASIVYAGRDGALWWQRGLRLDRITDGARPARGVVAGAVPPALLDGRVDGSPDRDLASDPAYGSDSGRVAVVYVLDEAEVWLTRLDDGRHRRLDDGRHEFCFDPSLAPDGSTVSWTGWSPPDMAWDGSVRVDVALADGTISETAVDDGAIQQPRFLATGERCHVHDGSGWRNVYVEGRAVVAETFEQAGPTWGMGNRSYAFDETGRWLAVARDESGFGALCVADVATGSVRRIGRGIHGQLSWSGDRVVALRTGARTPPQVVVYHDVTAPPAGPQGSGGSGEPARSGEPGRSGEPVRPARTVVATTAVSAWPLDRLPEPELVEAPASDGTTLHARRYAAGGGRMLCWVHGGPTDQWPVEWRPRITFWWSRGWDVLVVDPRGTTGHGRRYQQALHGRWGRLDVDDTADLVSHAHREGWATPAHTVVIGGSSGGLTALGVAADHPSLVAGVVTSYPVSDLRALTEATHRFEAHYTDTLVAPLDGSAESDRLFHELSPISRADRISVPLLVFHGSDDPVVPVSQSERLVETVREAGGEVEFVVYDGEGHGFRDPDHVADEYRRTETFLNRFA